MSTRKVKNKKKFDFFECWERVQTTTEVRNFVQLAELVETSVSNVTKRKGENSFPVEWAFKIGQQYGVSTEWIMTGEGPKRIEEAAKEGVRANQPSSGVTPDDFFAQLAEWARETSGTEDLQWIEKQIDVCFPAFRMWREEREEEAKKTALPTDKVA